MSPTKKAIDALARVLHRCPEDYEGPCWGPTDADRAAARDVLLLNTPGESFSAPATPETEA